MQGTSLVSSSSPRIGGKQLALAFAVHCEAWRRAWPSSWGAFSQARNTPTSCGASGRRGDFCRANCPPRLTGWSAEGPAGGGLALVNDCTLFEGCSPCSPWVLQRRKYKELAAQWREQCQACPHSASQVRTTPEWRHSDRSWRRGLRSCPLCGVATDAI